MDSWACLMQLIITVVCKCASSGRRVHVVTEQTDGFCNFANLNTSACQRIHLHVDKYFFIWTNTCARRQIHLQVRKYTAAEAHPGQVCTLQ